MSGCVERLWGAFSMSEMDSGHVRDRMSAHLVSGHVRLSALGIGLLLDKRRDYLSSLETLSGHSDASPGSMIAYAEGTSLG